MEADERARSLTRRQLLAAGAAAGAAAALPSGVFAQGVPTVVDADLAGTGDGWPGFAFDGCGNFTRAYGRGSVVAGTDLYPVDPRAVVFAVDRRVRDGEAVVELAEPGWMPGVVLRRTGPSAYYAGVYDADTATLAIERRTASGSQQLASTAVPVAVAPLELRFASTGAQPTQLRAALRDANGVSYAVAASDAAPALQVPGDAGLFATAWTGFPHGPGDENTFSAVNALSQGQQFDTTPAGLQRRELVRRRSTAVVTRFAVTSADRPAVTAASATAVANGVPLARGARVIVSTDVPAQVLLEVAGEPTFRAPRVFDAGSTGNFGALFAAVRSTACGERVYWRARFERRGTRSYGPVLDFRVLPEAGSGAPLRLALGTCATQFTPGFPTIAATRPDVLVWHGDLDYPDRAGHLMQNMGGYAGFWRALLSTPELVPFMRHATFAPGRDDHDYGSNNVENGDPIPDYAIRPWDSIMCPRPWYSFAGGLVETFVLDERRFGDPVGAPDTPAKSLLGAEQRRWLFDSLAASNAPFKVVCSPCPLYFPTNNDPGNWATGYIAERELLLAHIRRNVSGRTIFITGDTHSGAAIEIGDVVEIRAAPMCIPVQEVPASSGPGVVFSERGQFFAIIDVAATRGRATLEATLRRSEDGSIVYRKQLDSGPAPRRRAGRRCREGALALTVSPHRVRAGASTRFRVRVTTAGDRPVKGAIVRLGGRSARTDAHGRATIRARFAKPGRRPVTAARDGYAPASGTVRVVPRRSAPPRLTG